MLVEFGKQCPAFECWTASVAPESYTCKYCRGNRGVFNNGVDCGFSEIPTSEAKYKVGDNVFYRGLPYKIRKVFWDRRFEWRYIFARERNSHAEDEIFLTLQESHEDMAIKKFKEGLKALNKYCERYNLPIAPELKKLL